MSANIRKSIGNRPKRRVMSHGHTQVDRNVARASPSPNKVEHQVIRITMIRWSSSNTIVEYSMLVRRPLPFTSKASHTPSVHREI